MKKCGCTEPCGCGNNSLPLAPSCVQSYPSCDNPEQCSEVFSTDCVKYDGDTIVDLDIQKGMSVSEIIQKLALLVLGQGCVIPGGLCLSVIGFRSTAIGTGSASFSWGTLTGNVTYVLQFQQPGDLNWASLASTTLGSGTIIGLSSNTIYNIRVVSICGTSATCNSLTIQIKTK